MALKQVLVAMDINDLRDLLEGLRDQRLPDLSTSGGFDNAVNTLTNAYHQAVQARFPLSIVIPKDTQANEDGG